jgi:hypothetical protein
MDIEITYRDGPVQAEIRANEEEDYREVLDALSEFVDDYGGVTQTSVTANGEPEDSENEHGGDATLAEFDGGQADEIKSSGDEDAVSRDDDPDNRLLAETGLTEDELYRILKVGKVDDDEVDVFPRIIGETDILGDTIKERLLNGSTIILTVLSDYHGVDRVKTSNLKQALKDSGMKADSNFGNISTLREGEIYLNRRGSGNSATTEIRPPGRDKAYELVQKLAEN